MMSLLEERPIGLSRFPIYLLMFVYGLMFASGYASAFPLSDLPSELADSLEINETAARLIIVSAVLLGVGLLTTVSAKGNIALTSIVLLAFLGMLTAIGWAEPWLIIMAALVLALLFGAKLRDWGEGLRNSGD